MKKISLFILVLALALFFEPAYCQESGFDEEVVSASNKVISNIYDKIYLKKWNHQELKDFNSGVISKSKSGLLMLYYRYNEYMSIKEGELYHFGVMINEIGGKNEFFEIGSPFKYVFPILGVQLVGARADTIIQKNQYDFLPDVEGALKALWKLEQQRLPYGLKVVPSKKSYRINEKIDLSIEITNKTKTNQKLKELNSNILDISVNGKLFDTPGFDKDKIKKVKAAIYKPLQKKTRRIKLAGFDEPGEYQISCSYLVPYQRVFPQDVIKITVVE